MKKILIFLSLVFLFGSQSYAQIENEIKNFVDSTEIIVNNGRKLLLKSILDGDLQKATEIYQYLGSLTKNRSSVSFNYSENLVINLLTHNFDEFLHYAKQYKEFTKVRRIVNAGEIFEALIAEVKSRRFDIVDKAKNSGISNNDKVLVELIVILAVEGNKSDEYVNFYSQHAKSISAAGYADFMKFYVPKPVRKGNISFSMGGGAAFPTGKLSEYFTGNGTFQFGWDFTLERYFASLFLTGGTLNVNQPFAAQTSSQTFVFEKNEGFDYFEGGIISGYNVVNKENFKIVPYGLLASNTLRSKRFTAEESDKEIYVLRTACIGVGVSAKIKLFEYEPRNYYYYGLYGKGFVGLKLDCGINRPVKNEHKDFEGNITYLRLSLLWGFGDF